HVTVFARSGLLSGFEDFAADLVTSGLRSLGATVLHESPERVERIGDEVTLHRPDGSTVVADEVLVATGRVPRTSDLGLETAGLIPGEHVPVDDTLRVPGTEWLYAVGDVTG